jgi:hypothetical protein
MAGPFRAAVPRIDRARARRRPVAALQAPQAHGRPGKARPGRGADEGRALAPGPAIRPYRDGTAGPGRERREHLPRRAFGGPRLRASEAQEGIHAARAPREAEAREGLPRA